MLNELRELLRKYGLKPRKHLGQNFLINKDILSEIIKAADLNKNDTVLEIGPGLGILTKELAKKVKKVIAIEKDEKLVKILKKELSHLKDVEIVEGDILKFNIQYLVSNKYYKVVANLPYYITSPVIRKFLEEGNPPPSAKVSTFVKTSADRSGGRPKLMVLMVQKEVAERICAKPPDMSLLSVAVQFYSQAKIVKIVKKESFWPSPKVDSAIIKLTTNNLPRWQAGRQLTTINTNLFFKIVKAGFSQPRKQLKNNLKKIFGKDTEKILKQSKIETTRRAETLSIDDWLRICLNYKNRLK